MKCTVLLAAALGLAIAAASTAPIGADSPKPAASQPATLAPPAPPPPVAPPAPLSDTARAAVEALAKAPFGGASSAGGVSAQIRSAPVFSASITEALTKRALLSEPQAAAIDDVARFTFREPGWFFDTPVAAAAYSMGMEILPGGRRMVLFDAAKKPLGTQSYWITAPTDSQPSFSVGTANGAVMVTLACDAIRLPYRYVSEAAHAKPAAGDSVTRGRITLISDLGIPAIAESLAAEADAALDTEAKLLGGQLPPKQTFTLHLLGDAANFTALDTMLTGGTYGVRDGFSSWLTGRAYCRHLPRSDADSTADLALPLRVRAGVIHELHHLVAHALHPGATAWPEWLREGLAELGTQEGLAARSKEEGATFDRQILGTWRYAQQTGGVPSREDFFNDTSAGTVNGRYATAYLFMKRLRAKTKDLHAILARLDSEFIDAAGENIAREMLESAWGPAGALLRSVADEAMKADAPPAVVLGFMDQAADGQRLISAPKNTARVILPHVSKAHLSKITGSFAWQPAGARQADLYLGYRAGSQALHMLKVAFTPRSIVLLRFDKDRWENIGTMNFDSALAEKDGNTKRWHTVSAEIEGTAVRAIVDGNRTATFTLKAPIPVDETMLGYGAYDSVVYFKDMRAESK